VGYIRHRNGRLMKIHWSMHMDSASASQLLATVPDVQVEADTYSMVNCSM
jgi:hypothetical protein